MSEITDLNIPDHILSPSVERALTRPRPRWRGFLHKWAFVVSVPFIVVLAFLADTGLERFSAIMFGLGNSVMLGVSALVHYKPWSAERFHLLFRLDHSAIFFCMGATSTPFILLGLEGRARIVIISWFWIGSLFGIAMEWLPFHPPRGLMNTMYLTLGWGVIVAVPWLWDGLGPTGFWLLIGGGAVYTVGALVVGFQFPDPDPHVFGYHEIWHTMVVIGALTHTVLVVGVLLPR